MAEIKTESEFGQGLTYCLGLFLAHAEGARRWEETCKRIGSTDWAETWFNGASDHLYDLVIPESLPADLRERLAQFQSKVLTWGHGFKQPSATRDNVYWAIQEAKDLLREIDRASGITVIQGQWE